MGWTHFFEYISKNISNFASTMAHFFTDLMNFLGLFDMGVLAITLLGLLGAMTAGVGFIIMARWLEQR